MATYWKSESGSPYVWVKYSNGAVKKITVADWRKKGRPKLGIDPAIGLSGDDRDIFSVISGQLAEWGLTGLEQDVVDWITNDYSPDTINIMIQDTDTYKKRFAGNAARVKKGLPALSAAEYMSLEKQYRDVMSLAGVPKGFYDSNSDFQKFIEGDVSPNEVNARVTAASEAIHGMDPNARKLLNQWYGAGLTDGALVSFALDAKRALPLVQKQIEAAELSQQALDSGLGMRQALAERLATAGVQSSAATRGALEQAASLGKDFNRLADVYGAGRASEDELVEGALLGDQGLALRSRGLASRERAQFSGRTGLSDTTLKSDRAGDR